MDRSRHRGGSSRIAALLAGSTSLLLLMPLTGHAQQDTYLTEMPSSRQLSYGKVVYVDDGECPPGEIKEVRGGSKERGIARQVRCIARPASLPPKPPERTDPRSGGIGVSGPGGR